MYRLYPKKQDHATRGCKQESQMHWGNYKKGMALSIKTNYRKAKHRINQELKKISINATDEEIERFIIKSQYRYQEVWYEFD